MYFLRGNLPWQIGAVTAYNSAAAAGTIPGQVLHAFSLSLSCCWFLHVPSLAHIFLSCLLPRRICATDNIVSSSDTSETFLAFCVSLFVFRIPSHFQHLAPLLRSALAHASRLASLPVRCCSCDDDQASIRKWPLLLHSLPRTINSPSKKNMI